MNEKELETWMRERAYSGVDWDELMKLFKGNMLVDADYYHRLRQLALSVDTALVNTGSTLDTYDSPTAALNALIAWEIQVATDPRVNGGMKLVPADAVVLPPEGWLAPHDKGPWSAGKEGVFVFVQSEDFTHDVRLTISGDFADTEAKRRYADALAAQLNASLPPAPEQDNG